MTTTNQLARNKFILAKIETTYGVDSVPTASANAIEAFDFNLGAIEAEKAKRQAQKGWLGNRSEILGSFRSTIEFKCELAGSGSGATPPAYGPLLRCCGHSEAKLTTPLTGTSVGEQSSARIWLASGSSVDDYYTGCPIIVTGPQDEIHIAQIARYTGSDKIAYLSEIAPWRLDGRQYTIPANVNYNPVDKNYESATIYFQMDGVLKKMTGVRGTMSLSLQNKNIPVITFKLTGLYHDIADRTKPTPEYANQAVPMMVCADNTKIVSIHNQRVSMIEFSLDQENTIAFRSPAGGESRVLITDRASKGSVKFEAGLASEKDWEDAVTGRTIDGIYVLHGTAVGNRVGIGAESMQLMDPKDGEEDGLITTQLAISFTPNGPGRDYSLSFF